MNSSRVTSKALAVLAGSALAVATMAGCAPAPTPSTGSPSATGTPTATGTPSETPALTTVNVVASVQVWAGIAAQIGGQAVSAKAIISSPSQDPHSYEATVRDQLAVNQAQITIENGAGYDDYFARLLAAKPKLAGQSRINAATTLLAGPPIRPDTNPHFWYDFAFAKKVAGEVDRAIEAAAPASDRPQIAANYKSLAARIDQLTARAAQIRKKTMDAKVLLTESFAGYLLDALGMRNMTPAAFTNSVEQETDASPSVMNQIKQMIQGHQVRLVITNQQTSGAQTAQIQAWAKAAGVPALNLSELQPQHESYAAWMNQNLDAINGAIQ